MNKAELINRADKMQVELYKLREDIAKSDVDLLKQEGVLYEVWGSGNKGVQPYLRMQHGDIVTTEPDGDSMCWSNHKLHTPQWIKLPEGTTECPESLKVISGRTSIRFEDGSVSEETRTITDWTWAFPADHKYRPVAICILEEQ